ncbi:MAG: hypothetical protein U0230_08940 [Polyangiales bacterium]
MLRFARSRGARFVPALFVAWLSTSILAPSSATADPAGPTIPPAPCNCPSDVSIFPPRRPIAPGTVDLAMGMDLSYGRQMWADGPDDDAFAFRFDAAADVRFRRPVTLRVALDPVGVVHPSYAAAHPIGRLSIVPMFRSAVASIGGDSRDTSRVTAATSDRPFERAASPACCVSSSGIATGIGSC